MVAHPRDIVSFMISRKSHEYKANLVRLIQGDNYPEGPGFKSETIDVFSELLRDDIKIHTLARLSPFQARQTLIPQMDSPFSHRYEQLNLRRTTTRVYWKNTNSLGFDLYIDPNGGIALCLVHEKSHRNQHEPTYSKRTVVLRPVQL